MSDPLFGPKSKIEGAKANIQNLEGKLAAFFKADPYETFVEFNADKSKKSLKVRMKRRFPGYIHTVTGNILHDLRSSLDLLACCLAEKNGHTNTNDVYFPVGKTKEIFESPGVQKKIKKLSLDAQELIRGLYPYKGGNDVLFALHALNLTDKHKRLIPIVGVGGAGIHIEQLTVKGNSFSIGNLQWEPLKESVTLMTVGTTTEVQGNMKLRIMLQVAFAEVDILKGEPISTVLNSFVNLCESIILTVEKRFFA